jgi:ribosome-associated protein
MKERKLFLKDEGIKLGQLLKYANIIENGGEARYFLERVPVFVNGEHEKRRGRKLFSGDVIQIGEVAGCMSNRCV